MKKRTTLLMAIAVATCSILFSLAFQQDTTRQVPKVYYNISITGQDTLFAGEHIKLGEQMYNAGLLDSARNCFYRALEVYDAMPEDQIDSAVFTYRLNALFWAGFLSVYLNDLATGEKLLRECVDKATTRFSKTHYILSFAYIKLGYIYERRGDRYTAYNLIKNSYDMRVETVHDSSIWMRNGHGNMAWICTLLGKYDEALFHRKKILETAQTYFSDQRSLLSSAYLGMANILEKMGQQAESEAYLEKGLQLLDNLYPPGHVANLTPLRYRIEQLQKQGDYAAVKDLLYESIALSKKRAGTNHPSTAYYFNMMGDAWQQLGQPDSALHYHQQALTTFLPEMAEAPLLDLPQNLSPTLDAAVLEVLHNKANALTWYHDQYKQDVKFLRAALDYYLSAIHLVDAMRINALSPASKEVMNENLFPLFEHGLTLALRLHELTGEEARLQDAFFILEKSKAMALLATVRGNQLEESTLLPPSARQHEFELKSAIAYIQKVLADEKSRPDSLQDAKRLRDLSFALFEKTLEYDSLLEVFKKAYPTYHRMRHNTEVNTLAEVQAFLPDGTVLVEYFTGDSNLVVFTITDRTATARRLPIDSAFFTQVEGLRRLMDSPPPAGQKTARELQADFMKFTDLAHSLFETLLKPSLAGNMPRQLVIVPDGVLGYLPFEALLTRAPEAACHNYRRLPYLFIECPTRYEYSATLLLERRKSRRLPSERYAGFAPEYMGDELLASRGEDSLWTGRVYGHQFRNDGLAGLLYNQEEIREAGALTKGTTFLGQAAQERQFLQVAGKSRILHLAMHALTNDQEPSFSQLVFSLPDDTLHDGKLHVHEIYDLYMQADLAVLSACHTGTGRLRRGEGTMSLSRAFKAAGCPNLVVSLWWADDFSTKKLVTAFFKNLQSGMGKDAALQAARRHFLQEDAPEQFTHPFYWATLVLIGDDRPVPLGGSYWWMWAGVAGVLLGVVGWRWKRN